MPEGVDEEGREETSREAFSFYVVDDLVEEVAMSGDPELIAKLALLIV